MWLESAKHLPLFPLSCSSLFLPVLQVEALPILAKGCVLESIPTTVKSVDVFVYSYSMEKVYTGIY